MTSSARPSSEIGTVGPSALAVFSVALTRFAAEAGDDGMASCISLPAVAHLVQAVGERRIAEIRKSAAAGRVVERSDVDVRHLYLLRRTPHSHLRLSPFGAAPHAQ